MNRAEIHQTLRRAKYKIQDERHWTQGAEARDKNGAAVEPKSDDAVQWCAMGAVVACTNNPIVIADVDQLLRLVVEADSGYNGSKKDIGPVEFPSLSTFNFFNDHYATHKDIVGIFEVLLKLIQQTPASRLTTWLEDFEFEGVFPKDIEDILKTMREAK